jgi:hypothetical protein
MIISEFHESQMDELLSFLSRWSADHPELGQGDIVRWQQCYRFVAIHNDRIVGYIAQIPHDFKYGHLSGRTGIEHFGWAVSLVLDMSDDDIRKKAGRRLLKRCEDNSPLLYSGAGMVPAVEDVYRRRGHRIRRDCCKMYARFTRPVKALRYLARPVAYAPLIKLANMFHPVKATRQDLTGNVTWIENFSPSYDSRWDDILRNQYELYGVRTAEYLNYKLSQPNREYYVFYNRNGGYIILRTAKHPLKDLVLVKICDLVGLNWIKPQLLGLAMQYFHHSGADGIVALSSTKDEKLYHEAGMYISKPYPICLHKSITAKVHISFFDSDLDNLW